MRKTRTDESTGSINRPIVGAMVLILTILTTRAQSTPLFIEIGSSPTNTVLSGYDLKPIIDVVAVKTGMPDEVYVNREFVAALLANVSRPIVRVGVPTPEQLKNDPQEIARRESIAALTAALEQGTLTPTNVPAFWIFGDLAARARRVRITTKVEVPHASVLRLDVKWTGSPKYTIVGNTSGKPFGGETPSYDCPEITISYFCPQKKEALFTKKFLFTGSSSPDSITEMSRQSVNDFCRFFEKWTFPACDIGE